MTEELVQLPSFYAAPGLLLLARDSGAAVGCVGLRALDATTGELRRLFVAPQARSTGLGRALMDQLLAAAGERGFHRLVLTTLPTMTHALALYAGYGFTSAAPYVENPVEGVRYQALEL